MKSNKLRSKQKLHQIKTEFFVVGMLLISVIVMLSGCGSIKIESAIQPTPALSAVKDSPVAKTATLGTINPTVTTLNAPVPSISPTLTDWRLNWLKGIPCVAPCWENITPGKTSLDEARKILEKNVHVENNSIRLESEDIGLGTGYLVWNWKDGSLASSDIMYDLESSKHTVNRIYLSTFEAKLGDIIQKYGEPSHVEANRVGSTPSIGFAWFSQGLLGARNEGYKGKNPVLSPGLNITYIAFFSPTTLEKFVNTKGSVLRASQFIPWQGYKDYPFYCNLSMQTDIC